MTAKARRELVDLAASVVSDLSEGQARALASEIETMKEPALIAKIAGRNAPASVRSMSEEWVGGQALDAPTLATSIRCAARAVKAVTSHEKVELLYTGPGVGTIRRNEYGLLDVIRSAKHKLWVVSYLFHGLDEVLRALRERSESGVEICILLDHLKVKDFESARAVLVSYGLGEAIMIWADEHREYDRGYPRALHAKCAVADGHMAFISSANLTSKAMEQNLEVGVLVAGGATPSTLMQNFDQLTDDGALRQGNRAL